MLYFYKRVPSPCHNYINERGRMMTNVFFVDFLVEADLSDSYSLVELEAYLSEIVRFNGIADLNNVVFIEGWSLGTFDSDSNSIKTNYVEYQNYDILVIKGNDYSSAFKEHILRRAEVLAPDTNIRIKEAKIYLSMPSNEVLAYSFNPVVCESIEAVTSMETYLSINTYADNYDPHCETCKQMKDLVAKAFLEMNNCILFSESLIQGNPLDEWLSLTTKDRKDTIIKLNNANCGRIPFSGRVTLEKFADAFIQNMINELNVARITSLKFFDERGIGFLKEVPQHDDNDLILV